MNTALKAIALADDVTIIRAIDFFHDQLMTALPFSPDELWDQFKEASDSDPAIESIFAYVGQKAGVELSVADSVEFSRTILVSASQMPDMAALIEHCLRNWPDDRQSVGKRVSIGVLASLLLLVASVDVQYSDEHIKIHKKSIVPEKILIELNNLKVRLDIHNPDELVSKTP